MYFICNNLNEKNIKRKWWLAVLGGWGYGLCDRIALVGGCMYLPGFTCTGTDTSAQATGCAYWGMHSLYIQYYLRNDALYFSESGMSSGDDFLKDDDERRQFEKKTVALLTGPPGTGKTAAVYAVAEEVGYNVSPIE